MTRVVLILIAVATCATAGPVFAQDPEYQWVFLRRYHVVLFGAAMDIAATRVAQADARMIVKYRGDTVTRIVRRRWEGGGPLVLVDSLQPLRTARVRFELGIESIRYSDDFGASDVVPPAALDSLTAPAVSNAVVLRAPANRANLPLDPHDALELMSPYRTVAKGTIIGVYWETYGITPSEFVTTAVSVTSMSKNGAPITQTWLDRAPSIGASAVKDDAVPIVARSILLDTSKLPLGAYTLAIAITTASGQSARSEVMIAVR